MSLIFDSNWQIEDGSTATLTVQIPVLHSSNSIIGSLVLEPAMLNARMGGLRIFFFSVQRNNRDVGGKS